MNLDEIPDRFSSVEEANEYFRKLQDEKNTLREKNQKLIISARETQKAKGESLDYFNLVYSSLLEDYS